MEQVPCLIEIGQPEQKHKKSCYTKKIQNKNTNNKSYIVLLQKQRHDDMMHQCCQLSQNCNFSRIMIFQPIHFCSFRIPKLLFNIYKKLRPLWCIQYMLLVNSLHFNLIHFIFQLQRQHTANTLKLAQYKQNTFCSVSSQPAIQFWLEP